MKRIDLVLGGVSYKTQKAIRTRAQAIMQGAKMGVPLEGDDLAFVRDLLGRHHEADRKIGCGVATIQVLNAPGWNNRCFWVTRIDGSSTDFGVQSCIQPATHAHDVRSALRSEIVDQIAAFRRAVFAVPPVRCAVTGVFLTEGTSHVDHASPATFAALADEFLRDLDVASITLNGKGDGETTLSLNDRALAARWQAFHKERAVLRIVSAEANTGLLRRSKVEEAP